MREIKAPGFIDNSINEEIKIFLAGSIDMGSAENWQEDLVEELRGWYTARQGKTYVQLEDLKSILILNPRRDNWDPEWIQDFSNPNFYQQVNWELDGLEQADIVYMKITGESRAPISLLELGLCADKKTIIVCCDEKFWRKGNVQIICSRHSIPFYTTDFKAKQHLRFLLKKQ